MLEAAVVFPALQRRRAPAPVVGAVAGIATGLAGMMFVRVAFQAFPGSPWFPSLAILLVGLSLIAGAAVSVIAMRAMRPWIPRASRVPVSGVAVRLGSHAGRLVNISATGALVSVDGSVPVGSDWLLRFDVPPAPVELPARIVRASETGATEAGGPPRGECLVGVRFGDLSPTARQAVARLLGDHLRQNNAMSLA